MLSYDMLSISAKDTLVTTHFSETSGAVGLDYRRDMYKPSISTGGLQAGHQCERGSHQTRWVGEPARFLGGVRDGHFSAVDCAQYSKKGESPLEVLDVNELVQSLLWLLHGALLIGGGRGEGQACLRAAID